MTLLADENVDRSVVARLRAANYRVLAVGEMEPGVTDVEVLALANREGAFLVTEDKDFGELVFRQSLVHEGVILLRLAGLEAHAKGDLLLNALTEHGQELRGAFSVLSRGNLRIRARASEV